MMGWMSTIGNGLTEAAKGIGNGVSWAYNNGSINKATLSTLTYASNTIFQIGEEFLALKKAIPTLLKKPKSKQILKSMLTIAVNDVLPLVALNYGNNFIQGMYQSNEQRLQEVLSTYAVNVIWAGTKLVNWGIKGYIYRQEAQSFLRIAVLDVVGPPAFYAEKLTDGYDLCKDQQCTMKRRIKGNLREPFILLSNEVLASGIERIPYGGWVASKVLRVFFNGRYITRLATPDICERHKFQSIMQESTLALGVSYELVATGADMVLESTVGLPTAITHRTMRHLFLLFFANLAMNMKLPTIKPEEATLPFDPLNAYEGTCRFIADVIFSGLMARIPVDFKMDPDAMPIIPLDKVLKGATTALNADLEKVNPSGPGVVARVTKTVKQWALPPLLQSTHDFINDPVISRFWPTLQESCVEATKMLQGIVGSNTAAVVAWAPETVAATVYLLTGIPDNVTKFALTITNDKDFKQFLGALRAWLERHHVKKEVVIVAPQSPPIALHGEKQIIEPPAPKNDGSVAVVAQDIVSVRDKQTTPVPASSLIVVKKNDGLMDINPHAFLRKRGPNGGQAAMSATIATNPTSP
jgi:hypothetical protein